ncbi:MAG: dodecin domain-containing protein [Chloroflexi bacterium]|nr:MAG: dodecin domain-containing protein [Chloroflexota bacterium]TMD64973.1 MAG: dodecin domain-containing protein [Chloroflexota bacterium]
MAVLKILELVGTSKQSWSDAAREAVNEAAKTVRGIETVEVAESKAVVQNNKLTEYQVLVRIGFRIEGTASSTASRKKA